MLYDSIFELINGKLIHELEESSETLQNLQISLDEQMTSLVAELTHSQKVKLDKIMETYSKYLTENANLYFEKGVKIGGKISMIFKD